MDGFNGMFKLSSELKKRDFSKVFIFNSSLGYNVISRLAGIKSIYQYPFLEVKITLSVVRKFCRKCY